MLIRDGVGGERVKARPAARTDPEDQRGRGPPPEQLINAARCTVNFCVFVCARVFFVVAVSFRFKPAVRTTALSVYL